MCKSAVYVKTNINKVGLVLGAIFGTSERQSMAMTIQDEITNIKSKLIQSEPVYKIQKETISKYAFKRF